MVAQLIKIFPAFCGTQRRTVAYQVFVSSLESVVGCMNPAPFHLIHTIFRLLFCGKWTIVDLGDHHVARARVPSCIFYLFIYLFIYLFFIFIFFRETVCKHDI